MGCDIWEEWVGERQAPDGEEEEWGGCLLELLLGVLALEQPRFKVRRQRLRRRQSLRRRTL